MTHTAPLQRIVDEMADLLIGISTGTIILRDDDTNRERYARLRRRLHSVSSILGPPPEFLTSAETAWDFWARMKTYTTYADRRDFVHREFTQFYSSRLAAPAAGISFEDVLARRDLIIEEEVGRGGFGTVYRARHLTLDDDRAVKVFDPSFFSGDDDSALRRFAREARILVTISHPNVVRLFDGGIAAGRPFLVTAFVPGLNLQRDVDLRGVLPEASVRALLQQAALALEHVHSKGVFHRDIKPSNLIWDDTKGQLAILDFGAGVAVSGAPTTPLTTKAMGTPGFVAPELHLTPSLARPEIDIYSLGVTAHFALTGRLPHPSNLSKYLTEEAVTPGFQAVILKCVMPIEDCFESAGQLLAAISALPELSGRGVAGLMVVAEEEIGRVKGGDELPVRAGAIVESVAEWAGISAGGFGSDWFLRDESLGRNLSAAELADSTRFPRKPARVLLLTLLPF